MKIILHWLLTTAAILLASYLLPGVHVTGIKAAIVLAVVLGIINTFIRPVLSILTFPLTILTLGLFSLIINAALILLAARIVPGFSVDGFLWALVFGVVLAVVHFIIKRVD